MGGDWSVKEPASHSLIAPTLFIAGVLGRRRASFSDELVANGGFGR